MSKKPDAIIIGAGILGCAIAFELSKRGYQTLNLDKLPAAGFGSTSNSCAIVRAHYSTWDGVALAVENIRYWEDWAGYLGVEDERGLARYIQCGSVILRTQGKDFSRQLELFDRADFPYEHWSIDQLRQRVPIITSASLHPPRAIDDPAFWADPTDEMEGAIFTPQTGYVNDPQLATHNLQRAAEAHDAHFRFNETVTAIRQADGRIAGVTLASGEEIDAPIVINVAGPHSFVINRLAGVEEGMAIKTRALRHEVHHVPSPAAFDFERDGRHMSDQDAGIYYRPETGNTILVGSEDPACDPREWIADPDQYNRSLTTIQWQRQVYRLARRIPELEIPHQPQGVVDLYDVSDDWIPIYDRADLPGFYMAVGTSGNQFKNAGGVGHLMAELITACEAGHDQDGDPLQVTMPYTGVTLNTGFYSRRRTINRDSSFSVLG